MKPRHIGLTWSGLAQGLAILLFNPLPVMAVQVVSLVSNGEAKCCVVVGKNLGEKMVTADPHELDITTATHRRGENTLLISIDNTFPNQLGVGGITRPVLIYTIKQ